MKQLPFGDPGTPETRSPTRFLIWVGRRQLGTLVLGMTFGIVWMLAQALLPWVLGRAIDDGVATGDTQALLAWAGALFGLGVVQAVAGTLRHRVAVSNWLQSSYRMIQVVAHHAALTGPAVRTRLTTGEVVATVSNDALRAGGAFDITARLAGAIASYFVVAAILLSASTLLGLVVLLGVPVLVASLSTVIRPLQARQREQREQVGQLTAVGADTVAGLRVLRGIGGERVFLDRYRRRSEEVRLAGVRVALPQATLDSAQVLLPGVFVVIVTGLGARLAIEGTISAGELVAFYGYAAFLVIPLRVAAEAVDKLTRAHVGAQRMLAILRIEPLVGEPGKPAAEPAPGALLMDTRSGLVVEPGVLTPSSRPRPTKAPASRTVSAASSTTGSSRSAACRLRRSRSRSCRRRIVVSETDAHCSRAHSARSSTHGVGQRRAVARGHCGRERRGRARLAAGGARRHMEERGRSFSGGQRQRLVLARALLAEAEILVLVEPTSAVDAHTEARIAQRLHEARRGRTTVVMTGSPLVLDQADRVVLIAGGRVAATGTHRELLRSSPAYRFAVTREDAA